MGVESDGEHSMGELSFFLTKSQKCLNLLLDISNNVGNAKKLLWSEFATFEHYKEFSACLGSFEPSFIHKYIGINDDNI